METCMLQNWCWIALSNHKMIRLILLVIWNYWKVFTIHAHNKTKNALSNGKKITINFVKQEM